MKGFVVWIVAGLVWTFGTGVAPATTGILVHDGAYESHVLFGADAYWYWTPIAAIAYVVFSAIVAGLVALIIWADR